MRSGSPFGQSTAGSRGNSFDASAFNTKSLFELLGASDDVINDDADGISDAQSTGASAAKPAGAASPKSAPAAEDEQLDAAEKQLWDEVNNLVTTFGPVEGAVNIRIPNSKHHILVHGCLLIGKSAFCRAALSDNAKKSGEKELELPACSLTTLAYCLEWVYSDSILPQHGTICRCCAERDVTWPDLVNLWVFASDMGMPKLQNNIIDVLHSKMEDYLDHPSRSEDEVAHVRAAFNLLWPGKNQGHGQMAKSDAGEPLRNLMLAWFANPLYQTKAKADQLLAGGLSRSFFRDYALHEIEKNFSMVDDNVDDDVDSDLHIKAMQAVTDTHTLTCLWKIKPDRYHVNEKTFAASVGKKH